MNTIVTQPKKYLSFLVLLALVISHPACKKPKDASKAHTTQTDPTDDEALRCLNLPAAPYNYANITFPAHIQGMIPFFDNTPASNPITNDGATLGRVLFFDKALSVNNSTACASCHKQDMAFSDGVRVSAGHAGMNTRRNSMALLNLRFYRPGKMFWDERAATLEEQVLMPIEDPIEMGFTYAALLQRLNTLPYYKVLFRKAFGSVDITTDRIARALAQFLRSIVTYRSKYDRVQEGLASFTPQEAAGHALFRATGPSFACADCHGSGGNVNHFQFGVMPINNPPDFLNVNDLGVFEVTGDPSDSSKFKMPSLRNVFHTAPYMHNGSVQDINALFNNNYHRFFLTSTQKEEIIAFLHTLTDNDILTDPKYADPFK